jgi:hypothetical protein
MIQKHSKQNAGIKSLVKKYRTMFAIPENLNHYSEADYKIAEKKFLKHAIQKVGEVIGDVINSAE